MNQYWAFSLKIASEFICPELFPFSFDTPDVIIKNGKIPQQLFNRNVEKGVIQQITEKTLLLKIPRVANYYVQNGNEITIEITGNSNERSMRMYLLATVMAALLHQRKLLPMHASAALINNKLTLIVGNSGAGKSTVITGLYNKGYTIFSDDVVVLQNNHHTLMASAAYPMFKLWDNTIQHFGEKYSLNKTYNVKPGFKKYGYFFHENFNTQSCEIDNIIIVKRKKEGTIIARKLKMTEAFGELVKHIYKPQLIVDNQQKMISFNTLSKLIKQSAIYELKRPMQCNPDLLINAVQSLLV